ncbi:MAG: carboxypeptidase regulatory-like domain-containing protein [Euryarchaeota archaeon]|nr:carboxypeptidase regulatory-like domain-containing protein [Euryarchaeota archaeon]
MRGRPILALTLLPAILLSGCTGAAPAAVADASTPPAAGTGTVAGVITDDESKPVTGATVAFLDEPSTAESDFEGRFAITGVAPGSHSLVTQALGYEGFSKKIDVVSGETTTVNILLTPIAVETSRQEGYQLDAYMQFGASTPVVTARPGILLNDKLIFEKEVAGGVMSLVTAMTWDSSAPATAKKMRLDVIVGTSLKNQTNAKSPMMNVAEECEEPKTDCDVLFKKKSNVQHSIWIPFTCPYTQPTSDACTADPPSGFVVVVVEQRYKLYVTSFWGEVAPVDYTGLPP